MQFFGNSFPPKNKKKTLFFSRLKNWQNIKRIFPAQKDLRVCFAKFVNKNKLLKNENPVGIPSLFDNHKLKATATTKT